MCVETVMAAAYYNLDFNVINRILLSNTPQKQARRILISMVVVDVPHNVIGSDIVRPTLRTCVKTDGPSHRQTV